MVLNASGLRNKCFLAVKLLIKKECLDEDLLVCY